MGIPLAHPCPDSSKKLNAIALMLRPWSRWARRQRVEYSPMKILALETAADPGSVALWLDGRVVFR
ncbi:MAG: hypothetical protein LBQ62_03850, partial [Candidatus Accumulibacter sp.]|nr:hypothetical protein [Accumulibacter sp.]